MPWEAWVLIILFTLNAFSTVSLIGKPREPISNHMAVFIVATDLILVLLVGRIAQQ